MKIRINRDSVCAGDDCISHEKEFEIKDDMTLSEFLEIQKDVFPLASISGGKATWVLKGETYLAVLAQQWSEPKYAADALSLIKDNLNKSDKYRGELHFHYYAQDNPIKVYNKIGELEGKSTLHNDRKTRARWKVILPITFIVIFATIALWIAWPWISFSLAVYKLEGVESTRKSWIFRLNTYQDQISSSSVKTFYLKGVQHLAELNSHNNSFTFEDRFGYMGCATVVQYSNYYEYVSVFGGNDSDSFLMGRALGTFPPERFRNLKKLSTNELPDSIIRPW